MRQLVRLVLPPVQRDKDAKVVIARYHPNICARELRAKLVKPSRADALVRAINIVRGYRRVVRSLLRQIRHLDRLALCALAFGCHWRLVEIGLGLHALETLRRVLHLPLAAKELA